MIARSRGVITAAGRRALVAAARSRSSTASCRLAVNYGQFQVKRTFVSPSWSVAMPIKTVEVSETIMGYLYSGTVDHITLISGMLTVFFFWNRIIFGI
jgi:hypothetical protein